MDFYQYQENNFVINHLCIYLHFSTIHLFLIVPSRVSISRNQEANRNRVHSRIAQPAPTLRTSGGTGITTHSAPSRIESRRRHPVHVFMFMSMCNRVRSSAHKHNTHGHPFCTESLLHNTGLPPVLSSPKIAFSCSVASTAYSLIDYESVWLLHVVFS